MTDHRYKIAFRPSSSQSPVTSGALLAASDTGVGRSAGKVVDWLRSNYKFAAVAWLLAGGTSAPAACAGLRQPGGRYRRLGGVGDAPPLGRHLRQVQVLAGGLPQTPENTYHGQPQAKPVVRDYFWDPEEGPAAQVLVGVSGEASLAGPTGKPLPQHIHGHARANSFFNAMLAGIAQVSPELLLQRVVARGTDAGSQIFDVTLLHRGQPVVVSVDSRFYRRGDSKSGYFENNAVGVTCLTQAMWAALFEKAFIKLVDSFPDDFLQYAYLRDNAVDLRNSTALPRGWAALPDTLPEPTAASLAPTSLQKLRLDSNASQNQTVLAALQQIEQGQAVGVMALLDQQAYLQYPLLSQRLGFGIGNTNVNVLTLPSKHLCEVYLANPLDGAVVNTSVVTRVGCYAGASEVKIGEWRTQTAWGVFGWDTLSGNLTLHAPEYGPAAIRNDYNFDVPQAMRPPPMLASLRLLGELNATLFVAPLPAAAASDQVGRRISVPVPGTEEVAKALRKWRAGATLGRCGFDVNLEKKKFPAAYVGFSLAGGGILACLVGACCWWCGCCCSDKDEEVVEAPQASTDPAWLASQ